ncbi:sulfatase/phosphatase domain-containing protein [Algoriphagus boritolerans]|uniref:sulfatase/phosphatase domain-containing protein n=1 Tax=Algoriphagus boritolerans TaxID=308111 RepID=UPI000AEF09F2
MGHILVKNHCVAEKGCFMKGEFGYLFAYWPGKIRSGTTCEEPVISTDFYPTFLQLAGAKHPENYKLDGTSLVPLLNGEESINRESLFLAFSGISEFL